MIHYSLVKLPDGGYRPRLADDRVGHFLSAVKDFGQENPDTTFVRQINRWRLEKADPKATLSPPKKQIVWWVEDTVPHEYRPYVEEGILEWNKAFEKIGIRNAMAVRWQDAARRVRPRGHQLLHLPLDHQPVDVRDVVPAGQPDHRRDDRRRRDLRRELRPLLEAGLCRPDRDGPGLGGGRRGRHGPARRGRGHQPDHGGQVSVRDARPVGAPARRRGRDRAGGADLRLVPAEWGDAQALLHERLARGRMAGCEFNSGIRPEMGLAALALADAGKADEAGKLPEEFLGQMIKEVVMHEVGHSLGLRHNFHASTMLTADQLNDTAITRVKGQSGSVMDYNPINIAPKGQKQGDYVTTTIGPYDYWAIEYAYKPIDGDEAAELKKIAARSPDPDLAYATDEDMAGNDPLVNTYDLGSDPSRFALDRIALAAQLLKDLDARVVKDGESWARARSAFATLLSQWGNAAYLLSSYVGGQYVSRDHKGDKGSRDPVVPVPGSKQREALKALNEQVLSDKAFRFSPALLRKLAGERWYHWGNGSQSSAGGGVDYPIHERVLAIQKIVLNQCLVRRYAGEAPEPGAHGRRGERAAEDGRGLPDPDRRHLVGAGRAPGGREGQGVLGRSSRRCAATSSASTCAGSARWSSATDRAVPAIRWGSCSSPAPPPSRPMLARWPDSTSRRSTGGSARSWRGRTSRWTTRPAPTWRSVTPRSRRSSTRP